MKDYFAFTAAAFFILIFLLVLQKYRSPGLSGANQTAFPYHSKYILTKVEYRFYLAFKPLMDERSYIICPKVGMKDLFEVNRGTNQREKYFRKISQKHIDFLICDAALNPLFAVELDDKSHRTEQVKARDQFKNAVFSSAGMPLYRIPTASTYTAEYIQTYIPY